jgi:hypothetical protein
MAISNLIVGGQSFERPNVGAFFGKSPAGSNDNVEQVSSNFFGNDMFKAINGAIGVIGKELSKLQDFSKNIIKSFDALIKITRDLNRDITRRFRDTNDHMNQSRLDFLRSVMLTPVPASDRATTIGALVDKAEQKQTEAPPAEEKKSFLDSMLDLAGLAENAKDAFDLAKKYGPRIMQGARAFVGGAGLPITALAGGLVALAYQRKQAQEADPLGAENFDRATASGAKRAEVIQGPEADANAPNAGADISRKKLSPPDFLMREGIIKMPSEAKNVIANIKGDIITLKDGRYFDNKEQILRNPDGTPAGKTSSRESQDLRENKSESAAGTPAKVTSDEQDSKLDDAQRVNKRIAGLAAKNGLNPATVTAQLEGGIPTSITSDGVTIDVFNDLTDAEKEKVTTARKMRTEMQGGGKNTGAGTQQTPPPAAPPPAAEGAGGPEQKQQSAAPSAPAGGNEGAGSPEKAPPPSGGGTGGGTGGSETGAGSPTPATPPPAPSGSSSSGETGSTSASAAATTPSAPAAAGGAAEGMTGSPTGTGSPEAAPAAPSTPPAPPPVPEASSGGADPIIMNNASTQNVGSSSPGETSKMSGQNLPMNAQNEKIQEYLARQTVAYQ